MYFTYLHNILKECHLHFYINDSVNDNDVDVCAGLDWMEFIDVSSDKAILCNWNI